MLMVIFQAPLSAGTANRVAHCHSQTLRLLAFGFNCSELTAAAGSSEDNWERGEALEIKVEVRERLVMRKYAYSMWKVLQTHAAASVSLTSLPPPPLGRVTPAMQISL